MAIVSNATRFPNSLTKGAARKLKSLWGEDQVWLFPLETSDLGATTNTQAALMRTVGNTQFIHIEMAKELRDELASSASKREKLFDAIAPVVAKPAG